MTLFDGSERISGCTVVVEGGIINRVGDSSEVRIPAGATLVEGRGRTLMPGLIDAHVHVEDSKSLEQSLLFGVTTVFDMFSDYNLIAALKNQQNGSIGDRMAGLLSAGTLVTAPGGHGTEYELEIPTLKPGDDVAEFVKKRISEGSDYIKLVYDDGLVTGRSYPTLDRTTLGIVIEYAHKFGKKAVVHALAYDMAKEAAEAGCDGLVHLFVDREAESEFARYLSSMNAFVIPTLCVLESLCGIRGGAALLDESDFGEKLPKGSQENLERVFHPRKELDYSVCVRSLRKLKEAGVAILAGTDAPNPGTTYGASLHRELELLVRSGLTPVEALASATKVSAEHFGLKDRGVIKEGMRADLLLVDGDPTQDIQDTRRIVEVWKKGVRFDRDGPLLTSTRIQDVGSMQLKALAKV